MPIDRRHFALILIAAGAGLARADGLLLLDAYLRGTSAGRAEFTQVVTAPARQGQPPRVRRSSGVFEFIRPERFRFSYARPYEQVLVADGQTLWMHDPDLNQVTARSQAEALATSPVSLIAVATDLAALQRDFRLEAQGDGEGLVWVLAEPRVAGGPVQSLRVGLRPTARVPELARLEMVDGFGQRTVMEFSGWGPVSGPNAFRFRPPPGADLLRQ